MEDKRRSELEEEMSRFEQEIAGQLPPPPKPPSLSLLTSSSSSDSGRLSKSSVADDSGHQRASHDNEHSQSTQQIHRNQAMFSMPPPVQQSQQNTFPPPMHPPGFPQSGLPNPNLPMPPPLPNMGNPPLGMPRPPGPQMPPPMGPLVGMPRMPQQPMMPPPIPPMIPLLAPAPVSNVPVTTSAPVIKPPTVPLDNYEPLPSTGDGEDGGDSSRGADGKGDDSKRKDKKKKYVRVGGGTLWEDDTLSEWDPNDFRIFVGDLGNEVTDEHLYRAFAKYSSVLKARIVRDKKTKKTKGYGFVSFKDPQDYLKAMREMNGKYVGNRPIKLRKSTWKDRNIEVVKKKDKEKKKLGLR